MTEFPMIFWLLAGAALLLAALGIHYTLRRVAGEEPEETEAARDDEEDRERRWSCPFQDDCPWLSGVVDSCAECTVRPRACPGTGECIWRAVNVHACDNCPCGFVPREGGKHKKEAEMIHKTPHPLAPGRLRPVTDRKCHRLWWAGWVPERVVSTAQACPRCNFPLGRFDGTANGTLWYNPACGERKTVRTEANRRRLFICNRCGGLYTV